MSEHGRNRLPRISVIILNWNAKDYLKLCLESVLHTDYPNDFLEVMVVDNGSTDGSAEFIEENYPEARLIRSERNLGFCKGNNIGIRVASGDIIILLNNDTIVDSNWIRKILHEFEDSSVGVVGCRLLYPGTRIIQSMGFRERFLGYWESLRCGETYDEHIDYPKTVDYVSGAALAIRKTVIKKIGLLDPYFECVEDCELCFRAKKAGYNVVMSHAIVYHYGSISWKKFASIRLYLRISKSRHRLIRKYYPQRTFLKYVIEWPIKILRLGWYRLTIGETVLQRLVSNDNNVSRKRILLTALGQFTLELVSFFIGLLYSFELDAYQGPCFLPTPTDEKT